MATPFHGERPKILITGMSGLIGGLLGEALPDRYQIRALNRRLVEGVECIQADIADLTAIRPAFEGIHTVVHLAAYAHLDDELAPHLQTNVIGTFNVFEASRQAGVKRIIFASSGATVFYYERQEPFKAMVEARWGDVPEARPLVTHLSPVRPATLYGVSKVWGETLGRYYSDAFGISVVCVRIGRVTKDNKPESARYAAVYCSHRDVVQMIERCIDAPDSVRYDIFYAVSDNRGRFRDIEHASEIIGYQPLDGVPGWPMPEGNSPNE
jgi:nucleoside-diphosphate-sugar epimerase